MIMLLVIIYDVRFTAHGQVKTHETSAWLPIVMLAERVGFFYAVQHRSRLKMSCYWDDVISSWLRLGSCSSNSIESKKFARASALLRILL